MKPWEYCERQHYEAFVLRMLLNRALIEVQEGEGRGPSPGNGKHPR